MSAFVTSIDFLIKIMRFAERFAPLDSYSMFFVLEDLSLRGAGGKPAQIRPFHCLHTIS